MNADDIRLALLMTNTTADTEQDTIFFMDDFTTLDECDGANYVRKALASEAVATDLTNDRAEFDADDVTWSALGNGTRAINGVLVFKHVTDDTDSIPIAWFEFSPTQNPGSSDFSLIWSAEGILHLT